MNEQCLEIGAIQAFLDGEAPQGLALRVASHIERCDACAERLAAAEEESAMVFSALDRELNMLVPTQRLWTRINDSIAVGKEQASPWKRFVDALAGQLRNPSFAAAAGVVVVFGLMAVAVTMFSGSNEIANVVPSPVDVNETGGPATVDVAVTSGGADVLAPTSSALPPSAAPAAPDALVSRSNLSNAALQRIVQPARAARGARPEYAVVSNAALELPGEESYLKTISDLERNVNGQKDNVLSPSSRVSYERDIAVVNDSIKKMRNVVRRNPSNQSARQVLYSSYQNKIDLLNSVAERGELMASLK
jgi:hypothetical protein